MILSSESVYIDGKAARNNRSNWWRYDLPANAPSTDLEADTQPKMAPWAFIIANPIS